MPTCPGLHTLRILLACREGGERGSRIGGWEEEEEGCRTSANKDPAAGVLHVCIHMLLVCLAALLRGDLL